MRARPSGISGLEIAAEEDGAGLRSSKDGVGQGEHPGCPAPGANGTELE